MFRRTEEQGIKRETKVEDVRGKEWKMRQPSRVLSVTMDRKRVRLGNVTSGSSTVTWRYRVESVETEGTRRVS